MLFHLHRSPAQCENSCESVNVLNESSNSLGSCCARPVCAAAGQADRKSASKWRISDGMFCSRFVHTVATAEQPNYGQWKQRITRFEFISVSVCARSACTAHNLINCTAIFKLNCACAQSENYSPSFLSVFVVGSLPISFRQNYSFHCRLSPSLTA